MTLNDFEIQKTGFCTYCRPTYCRPSVRLSVVVCLPSLADVCIVAKR